MSLCISVVASELSEGSVDFCASTGAGSFKELWAQSYGSAFA